jgi:hypothetical protein
MTMPEIDVDKQPNDTLCPFRPKRLAVGEVDRMVAVPEEYFQTVFFLCVDKPDETNKRIVKREPQATGFFVRVPLNSNPPAGADYLITARHCIEDARQYGGTLYVRINKKAGGFIEIPTSVDDWVAHDDADVAAILGIRTALPEGTNSTDLDQASLRLASFVGPGPEYKYTGEAPGVGTVEIQPRVGHEIYFLGLFSQHYGHERNLPVARFGHISRMPCQLEMESGGTRFEAVAYLAEFHSWGGHRGSPVFFFYPMMLRTDYVDDQGNVTRAGDQPIHVSGFMGLISGHYDISKEAKKVGDILGQVQFELNSGIAMVTPAEAVKQLLMRDDLVAERENPKKKVEWGRPAPTLDFGDAHGEFTRSDEASR